MIDYSLLAVLKDRPNVANAECRKRRMSEEFCSGVLMSTNMPKARCYIRIATLLVPVK